MNKKGFTLIELLVVVLIIGILSAVALPQYQKTVLKSRAAEAWSNLGALRKAVASYCLENPDAGYISYANIKDSLPIEIQDSKYFSYGGHSISCNQTDSWAYLAVSAKYLGGNSSNTFDLGINGEGRRVCGGPGCKDLGAKISASAACMCGVVADGTSLCYPMD